MTYGEPNGASAQTAGRLDFWILAGLIAVFNLPLLSGQVAGGLLYDPDLVLQAQWWRLFTAPFVHLSLYHLALDAGAFLMLYRDLAETRLVRKALILVGAWAVSLLAARALPGGGPAAGLCGLSGMAHGLMAVRGLELVFASGGDPSEHRTGLALFLIVVGKSLLEALTGRVFFAALHFGYIGIPVSACHAGGVLGGVLVFLAFRLFHPSRRSLHMLKGAYPK